MNRLEPKDETHQSGQKVALFCCQQYETRMEDKWKTSKVLFSIYCQLTTVSKKKSKNKNNCKRKKPNSYLNKFSFTSTLRKIYFILDLELQIAIVKSALDLHPIFL